MFDEKSMLWGVNLFFDHASRDFFDQVLAGLTSNYGRPAAKDSRAGILPQETRVWPDGRLKCIYDDYRSASNPGSITIYYRRDPAPVQELKHEL